MPSDRGTVLEMADPGAMQGDVRRLPHRRRRGRPRRGRGLCRVLQRRTPHVLLGIHDAEAIQEVALKREPRPLPPYQCRHLPTVAYPKLNIMATND